MKKVFNGGIHPPELKNPQNKSSIVKAHIPHRIILPLSQHIGKPAIPLVKKGDIVKEGQIVAEANGYVSLNIHASIPGKVIDIGRYHTVSGFKDAIVIETEGEFSTSARISVKKDFSKLDNKKILSIIRESGIAGLGGAAFPTHVKLSPPQDASIDTLIINGCECEPYLSVDHRMMLEHGEELLIGIEILIKLLSPKRVLIGIEDNKKNAAYALRKLSKNPIISIEILKTKYPQGAEKQLIYALTERKIKPGKLPLSVGVIVQNVSTVIAIYKAVVFGKPLIERLITIAGTPIKENKNIMVRIGTTISEVLEEVDIVSDIDKIIMGGPMCGTAVPSMDIPIVKGTSGILLFSKKEVKAKRIYPCIRCSKCIDICPMALFPTAIERVVINNSEIDRIKVYNPDQCIECGSCSYICPSNRALAEAIKLAKLKVRNG